MSGHAYVHTCRACMGSGCVHCNGRGQVRQRVFRRQDGEAVRLRALILGTDRTDKTTIPRWDKPSPTLKEMLLS